MGDTIRVCMVDDHALVRDGLAALFRQEEDIRIVGECGTGAEALRLVRRCHPDVVLLDISLPDMNGIDLCRKLRRIVRSLAVLVVTMHAEEEYIVEALRAGALGYVLKESASDQLIRAVRTVSRGQRYLPKGTSSDVVERARNRKRHGPFASLTPRERQVLQHIAEGMSSRKAAECMGVSVKTVETFRWRMMKKLDIHDQTSLVKYAIRNVLVHLG